MNRGGTIENIYMTRVSAENISQVLAADLNWNPSYSYSTLPKEYEGKEQENEEILGCIFFGNDAFNRM